jgi:hypothetical protein
VSRGIARAGLSPLEPPSIFAKLSTPAAVRASPQLRLIALWALLVFAFGWGGDALVLHPCPHHSAIAHAGASGHGAAASGHHAAAHDDAPASHDAGSHAGGCSCIVACAGSSDALAGGPVEILISPPVVRIARIVPAAHATVLPERLAYLLPYPTAPPAVLS